MNVSNPELQLANDFVEQTSHHIFLTGKAGTGKTTFLRHLKERTPKRMIVTAPTGVAAINARGVTLHSFFQLPFAPFVPGSEAYGEMSQHRMSKEKINIIKSLDLLVIDEISMVRSDLLDGVDAVLRRYRRRNEPFGGVQLLMIGDLYQLPPVVRDEDWNILTQYYESCYFFSSNALRRTEMVSIELKHIYRQSDESFIQLLNRVRNNRMDENTLEKLNSRYIPTFQTRKEENYITLTTHNRNADEINKTRLRELNSTPFTFQATIEGDYPEYIYPTSKSLVLKKDAQVMFVRNDISEEKLYYNGKIGKITHIAKDNIMVKCPGDLKEIRVERIVWENVKYTLNEETKAIEEEVIGLFTQYPMRLAWAITIHKSQGLTFEKAIIDAHAAFAHGQVYVALSRCKTFEGMVLKSPVSMRSLAKTDHTVSQFMEHTYQNAPTLQQLNHAKILYQQKLIEECFDCEGLRSHFIKLLRILRDHHRLIRFSGFETIGSLEKQVFEEILTISENFKRELHQLFDHNKVPEEDSYLQERVRKASHYFTEKLQGLINWAFSSHFETDNKEVRKNIKQAFEFLQHTLVIKTAGMRSCQEYFSIAAYLNAIDIAQIDFKSAVSAKKQTVDYTLSDLEHPELFKMLSDWRRKKAHEEEVEHYRILHQKVLIQIAVVLPNNPEALMTIKGIGKATSKKYGTELIGIVSDYCRMHHIEPPQLPLEDTKTKKAKKRLQLDTKQISYDLYLAGKNIKEIALERGLVTTTIETHLAHFIGIGQLKITDVIDEEKIERIKEAFAKKGENSVKDVKLHLGDHFSYGEIHMVKNHLAYEKKL